MGATNKWINQYHKSIFPVCQKLDIITQVWTLGQSREWCVLLKQQFSDIKQGAAGVTAIPAPLGFNIYFLNCIQRKWESETQKTGTRIDKQMIEQNGVWD